LTHAEIVSAADERRALQNLKRHVIWDRRLPENVFSTSVHEFRLFSSDEIFRTEFVEKVKTLLRLESASCACMVNLDVSIGLINDEQQVFLFDASTTVDAYLDRLKGNAASTGWVHNMNRFGVTSDIGGWFIYCEKVNELAIIGFKNEITEIQVRYMAQQFGALPTAEALADKVSVIFASGALPKEWFERFVAAYSQ
jgi:hypothetical protein